MWGPEPGCESLETRMAHSESWQKHTEYDMYSTYIFKVSFLTFKGSTITKGQVIDLVVLDCSKLWRIWTPENQEKGAVLAVTKRALDTRVP